MTAYAASAFCITCISSHQSSFRAIPESSCENLHSQLPLLDQIELRMESVAANQKVLNLQEGRSYSFNAFSAPSWNRLFKYNHLRMSSSSRSASFRHLIISLYIDLASSGGKAFPIWRRALVLESAEKLCDIENVCKQADSLVV
jgi:hypothetical protein